MKATEFYKDLQINLPEYGFKFDKYGLYNTVNHKYLQISVCCKRNNVTVTVDNGFEYLTDTTNWNKAFKPNMVALTGEKIEEFASRLK